ncbi:hypothetical protein AK95_07740 [Paenibacillus sp. LC231]|nr:hypothetical protein AK95_07740 [Paenibacillus sp. LC231]
MAALSYQILVLIKTSLLRVAGHAYNVDESKDTTEIALSQMGIYDEMCRIRACADLLTEGLLCGLGRLIQTRVEPVLRLYDQVTEANHRKAARLIDKKIPRSVIKAYGVMSKIEEAIQLEKEKVLTS